MTIEESYIEMRRKVILESPMIHHDIPHSHVDNVLSNFRDYIKENHSKSTSIGDNYHHLFRKSDLKHIYYNYKDNKPNEISVINHDHTQTLVSKGVNGNSSHIHNFMKHHLETHGKLMTDIDNTNGSKKLWVDFIKKNKDINFNSSHDYIHKQTKLDHSNIDSHIDKIWGTTDEHKNTRIVAHT